MKDLKLRNMSALYLINKEEIALLYRIGSRVVKDSYIGSAGGHFEQEEVNDAKACILREVKEELGLEEQDLCNLTLRYVTLRLKNKEIRQNYYFFAELTSYKKALSSNEGELTWFPFADTTSLEMPFTAKDVVAHYIKTGRFTSVLYSGITTEHGVRFIELTEFEDA